MKRYMLLLFLIIADVSLFVILRKVDGIWIQAAFAAALWFTLVTVLKIFSDYLERRDLKAWIKRLAAIATDIVEIAALLFAFVFIYQDVALFHPNDDPVSRQYILSRQEFTEVIVDGDGKVYHGYMRRDDSDEPSPIIIFFVGNGENAARMMQAMDSAGAWASFLNYNCLIMDYPGYGINSGTPSAKTMFEEALLTYDYAVSLPYVDINRVLIGGVSVGTGPAVYLAANRQAAGLFLLAPYASGYDLYNSVLPVFHGPLRLLVKHKFTSDQYAASITAPVLIIASKSDEIVPFASSEKLVKCFPDEPTFVTLSGVGHNGIMFNKTTLSSIQSFLVSLMK